MELTGKERKYLKGLAHGLEPVVMLGKNGPTDGFFAAIEQALEQHELIKVRFVEHKDEKSEIAAATAQRTTSQLVSVLGHVAIFYRPHSDPQKKRIHFPP